MMVRTLHRVELNEAKFIESSKRLLSEFEEDLQPVHHQGSEEELKVKNHSKRTRNIAWQKMKGQIDNAGKTGQNVVNRIEGRIEGVQKAGDPAMERLASAYAKKKGVGYDEKSLEPTVKKSWNPVTRAKDEAISHAMKSSDPAYKGKASWLTKKLIKGRDAFPEDTGGKESWVSKGVIKANKVRQDGFRANVEADKKAGNVPIGTAGEGHFPTHMRPKPPSPTGAELKADDSAARHDKFVKSGQYAKRARALGAQGKIMREEFKRTLHRVELNESNNDQRDDSHVSTVTNANMKTKLDAMGGSRNMDDLDDPRRSGLGLKPRPKLTPREKLKAIYRADRVRRTENFKGAISQGRSAISRKFKKGWKGATLEPEKAAQERAKWPNPSGSAHVLSRGVKKERGAKPLPGEVHGEEKDMSRPVGEGGEVTRNLVARKMEKPREGGNQVVPKTPPFQSHDDNIRSMVRLGNEYGGTPSRKDRAHPAKKPIQRQSQKKADVNKPPLSGTTYSQG